MSISYRRRGESLFRYAAASPREHASIATARVSVQSAPSVGSDRLVSAACDPGEFVRHAVAWDRARLVVEVQREMWAASLVWDRSLVERTRPPRGCRSYVNFLGRLEDWLTAAIVPRHPRRETRELLLAVSDAAGLLARRRRGV